MTCYLLEFLIKMATPPREVDDEIDFDDYEEPCTDEGMSEEEEDYLDFLLGDNEEELNDFDHDDPWIPTDTYISSQSSIESGSSSCTTNSTRIYWKDENSNDDGAPVQTKQETRHTIWKIV
ncbi:uncharacterized protein LOC127722310 [Mytilus californianus]|uniref:uncharacterized protein LOC127722310 n=1 Tax=Mytilus californianus TaxID=6549 RepID=UPI002247CDE8|nr:uncharacterized protein LOC127722310 [Mytilus californianus]